MTANHADVPAQVTRSPTLDEILSGKGLTKPVTINDLSGDGIFDSDEELEEFLTFVSEQRLEHLA